METTTPRIDQFKSDIEDMKLKTGTSSKEGPLQALGVLLMIAGIAVAFGAYSASLNVKVGEAGNLDSNSYLIMGVGGLALTVSGAALFIRYSIAKFLRFWLLRQMYEGQSHIDQVVDAINTR